MDESLGQRVDFLLHELRSERNKHFQRHKDCLQDAERWQGPKDYAQLKREIAAEELARAEAFRHAIEAVEVYLGKEIKEFSECA